MAHDSVHKVKFCDEQRWSSKKRKKDIVNGNDDGFGCICVSLVSTSSREHRHHGNVLPTVSSHTHVCDGASMLVSVDVACVGVLAAVAGMPLSMS